MTQGIKNNPEPGIPGGFIDLHHHILHGVDDGPRTREESLAMLTLAYREGTRRIIATSHFDPLGDCPEVEKLRLQLEELNAACAERFPGLALLPGAEVFFGEGVRRRLRTGLIPTLAGGDHVLVEFVPSVEKEALEKAVRHLANGGYVTILAHMERYPALVKDPAFARHLKEKYGALLQVNADSFLLPQRLSVRRFLKHAVPEGLVDFVASDAHGTMRRRSRLMEAYNVLSNLHGEAVTRSLFQDNAGRVLQGL